LGGDSLRGHVSPHPPSLVQRRAGHLWAQPIAVDRAGLRCRGGPLNENENEPIPEPSMPDCPPELGPVACQEWDRLVAQSAPLRILTHLDRAALASSCAAYSLGLKRSKPRRDMENGEIAIARRAQQKELQSWMRVARKLAAACCTDSSRREISTQRPTSERRYCSPLEFVSDLDIA
jgi:hypothetical protein